MSCYGQNLKQNLPMGSNVPVAARSARLWGGSRWWCVARTQLTRHQLAKLQHGQQRLGLSPSPMGLQEASLSFYPNQGHWLVLARKWVWNQLPVFFHKDILFFLSQELQKEYVYVKSKGPFWVDGPCLNKWEALDLPLCQTIWGTSCLV